MFSTTDLFGFKYFSIFLLMKNYEGIVSGGRASFFVVEKNSLSFICFFENSSLTIHYWLRSQDAVAFSHSQY